MSVLDPWTSTSPENAATDRPGGRRNRLSAFSSGGRTGSGTACTSRTSVDGVSHHVQPDDAARISAAAAHDLVGGEPVGGVDDAREVRAPQPETLQRRDVDRARDGDPHLLPGRQRDMDLVVDDAGREGVPGLDHEAQRLE